MTEVSNSVFRKIACILAYVYCIKGPVLPLKSTDSLGSKVIFFLGLLLTFSSLTAQKKVTETKKSSGIDEVFVHVKFADNIVVKNWNKNEITVEEAKSAKFLLIGSDQKIEKMDRFEGIPAVRVDINMCIKKPKAVIDKEQELVTEELKNSGKPEDIAKKISLGKMNKFKEENALLSQAWVMEPKKKVQDIVKELSISDLKINLINFYLNIPLWHYYNDMIKMRDYITIYLRFKYSIITICI